MITLLVLACLWATRVLVPAADSPLFVGPGGGRVLLADTNGDGHLDLITQHLLHQRVQVRLGDGRGRFGPSTSIEFSFQPGPIALGELNGDGIPDLAIATQHGDDEAVAILLGHGKSAFSPPATFRTNMRGKLYKPFLRLVDIDEDRRLDVVTSNGRRNSVGIGI